MGRIPTGKPKGRPKGTGRLGEHVTRLTVRIPDDLYQRFAAFADGRTFHRGDTQLADSVRDALAHYLACPHKRQTRNGTVSSYDTIEQTTNGTEDSSTDTQQTHNGTVPSMPLGLAEPLPLVPYIEQTQKSTESILEADDGNLRQTESTPPMVPDTADVDAMPPAPVAISQQPVQPAPGYDPTKYTLGKLCPRGHAYHGTGQSLLRLSNRHCLACDREKFHERTQAKRQTQPA